MATFEDAQQAALAAFTAVAKRLETEAPIQGASYVESLGTALNQAAEAYAWLVVPGRDH